MQIADLALTLMKLFFLHLLIQFKQGVALMGRNTTGPPGSRGAIIRRHRLAAACSLAVQCYRPRQTTTTNDRRRQTPATVTNLSPHYV